MLPFAEQPLPVVGEAPEFPEGDAPLSAEPLFDLPELKYVGEMWPARHGQRHVIAVLHDGAVEGNAELRFLLLLLRGWTSVTRPRTFVSLATMTSPLLAFMSMVTLASTSSPGLTFLTSKLLVSCPGITLPGAMRGTEFAGAAAASEAAALGGIGVGVLLGLDGAAFSRREAT